MSRKLPTYVRSFRRRHGLSHENFAFLLGVKSSSHVSRIERAERRPNAPILIACSLIFGCPATDLFPMLFADARAGLLQRAQKLFDDLQGNPRRITGAKLDLLEDLLKRLSDDDAAPLL